jgi:Uma2 family endonuclease
MLTATKRFTLDEYHRLIEIGFFAAGDRIELIRGEILPMAAKGTPHVVCCTNAIEQLLPLVSGRAKLRCQDPITLPSGSEPEPDFAIVRLRQDNYLSGHPTPEDILLAIEISDSTLDYDRSIKLPLYAEANISDYWLFNLVENYLEAYTQPYQKPMGGFDYALKRIWLPQQTVALPHFPELSLDLAYIFP